MSVRRTSIDTLNKMKASGMLSTRRMEVYEALNEYGPCTANELFRRWKVRTYITQQNIHPRLGELRERGVVQEVGTKTCEVTGSTVIVWAVIPEKLPVKFDAPIKHKCKHCGGKGYFLEQQGKLF